MAGRNGRADVDVRGWTALVTGASGGIGEAFARALAARGAHLVLVARSEAKLEALAAELRSGGTVVTVLPADLSAPGAADALVESVAASGTVVDLVVNNAGVGSHGPVVDEDPAAAVAQVRLNCEAMLALTMRLLPGMVGRGRGGVLNVGSTSGFQPVATMAVYAATKAFVLSFTEALWAETRGTGVRVLALAPGPVETGFFAAAGGGDFLTRGRWSPERVVAVGLQAFTRGRGPVVVPGAKNAALAQGYRFAPRALMARLSSRVVG